MTLKQIVTVVIVFLIIAVGSGLYVSVADERTDLPEGWFKAGKSPGDYDARIDGQVRHGGESSGLIKSTIPGPSGFGTLMQMCKAGNFLGKRVRMTGYIKVEEVDNWVGMWRYIQKLWME